MYADQAFYKVVVMDDIKEKLKEKTISFWIRMILRAMAWLVLSFLVIYQIIIPVKSGERLDIGNQEVNIMLFCIGILLAVEAVRAAYVRFFEKK